MPAFHIVAIYVSLRTFHEPRTYSLFNCFSYCVAYALEGIVIVIYSRAEFSVEIFNYTDCDLLYIGNNIARQLYIVKFRKLCDLVYIVSELCAVLFVSITCVAILAKQNKA